MHELAAELRATFPKITFAVEYGNGFAAEPGYVHDWEINPRVDRRGNPIPDPPIGDLDAIFVQPGVKLLAKDRGADADELLAAATDLVGTRASITHSSAYGLLELARAGVTKASGLAELAARHGIDRADVLPMLRWAGHSFAVANGHPAARAAAAQTIGRNTDDAVAVLIEQVLAAPRG